MATNRGRNHEITTDGAATRQHDRGRLVHRRPAQPARSARRSRKTRNDFDAEQAERYGWINRALPDADLDAFFCPARAAHRVVPAEAVRSAKQVLNEMTLPAADAVRADARRFHQLVASDTAKSRTAALFAQGPQTRSPLELDLGDRIGSL